MHHQVGISFPKKKEQMDLNSIQLMLITLRWINLIFI